MHTVEKIALLCWLWKSTECRRHASWKCNWSLSLNWKRHMYVTPWPWPGWVVGRWMDENKCQWLSQSAKAEASMSHGYNKFTCCVFVAETSWTETHFPNLTQVSFPSIAVFTMVTMKPFNVLWENLTLVVLRTLIPASLKQPLHWPLHPSLDGFTSNTKPAGEPWAMRRSHMVAL